ncbi:MAG TPA: S41 family peptidase, partial [Pseudomonadales bacterium]|nr:S41 family peptidase [Pseudomonadales bacterium]
LGSDIEEFQKYRNQFDNYLLEGKLDVPFMIFNRFQTRSYERVQWLIAELETNLSKIKFDDNEQLPRERAKAPWPANKQEADDLWRRRLKDELLKLKLSGKTTDQAADKLMKRFRNQLRRASQANSEDAFQIFMNSVAQIYDPHTNYFSPRAAEDFSINMSLQFAGIGAELVAEDEYVKVARLIEASPAQKSGKLKPADRIIGVAQGNGEMEDVVGWRLDDVVAKIRGPVNTVVRLQIIPANSETEDNTHIISITRSMIKLEDRTAKSRVIPLEDHGHTYKLGVIEVPSFYSDFTGQKNGKDDYTSATRDVAKNITDLKKQKVDGIIIDLRNNGGGSLQEAISMVGLFIETGPAVQVRSAQGINSFTDDDPSVIWDGPLA